MSRGPPNTQNKPMHIKVLNAKNQKNAFLNINPIIYLSYQRTNGKQHNERKKSLRMVLFFHGCDFFLTVSVVLRVHFKPLLSAETLWHTHTTTLTHTFADLKHMQIEYNSINCSEFIITSILSLPFSLSYTHTHTHTSTRIFISLERLLMKGQPLSYDSISWMQQPNNPSVGGRAASVYLFGKCLRDADGDWERGRHVMSVWWCRRAGKVIGGRKSQVLEGGGEKEFISVCGTGKTDRFQEKLDHGEGPGMWGEMEDMSMDITVKEKREWEMAEGEFQERG